MNGRRGLTDRALCTPRPIHLLYLIPSFGTGGTERLIVDLLEHLDPNRFWVSACAQQGGLMGDAFVQGRHSLTVLADSVDRRGSGIVGKAHSLTRRVACLRALVERDRIDIVHTHHLGPLLHAYLAGLGARRWRWVHTEHVRPEVDDGYARWLLWVARRMFPSADVVTGVSDAVGAYFHEETRVPPERVKVILNGVDVDRLAGKYDAESKRRELGIPPEAWVIGLVANLRPQKNHALLLRAFAGLCPQVPQARLILVGEGGLRSALAGLADELGVRDRVHFLGARLDIAELFAALDVYCLPSHYEGMPLTLLEAMAAGKPVVATRVLGIRELISDGETGLLVPPGDPDALAAALIRIRMEPGLGQRLADAGREYVNKHARLEFMVTQYAALYEQLLTRGIREPVPE